MLVRAFYFQKGRSKMKKLILFCLLSIFYLQEPAFSALNFIDNGNGTVTDDRTGLIWLKDGRSRGLMTYPEAVAYCSSLANGQWRLPTIEELEGLGTDPPAMWGGTPSVPWTMPGAPFINVQSDKYYWSATGNGPYGAKIIYMPSGTLSSCLNMNTNSDSQYVWPVRGEQDGPLGDRDNDGIPNEQDNCKYFYNPDQADADSDGVGNACDKCPNIYNPDQTDDDNDGIGNECDVDYLRAALQQCRTALDDCQNPPTTTTVPPTNIELSLLDALPSNEKVTLKWQTESEIDNAGFNIWRAEGFQKVNASFIPALGSTVSGSEYDFVDQWVLNGKRYFYLLEDIDNNGISTFHGPVKATPRWIYGAGK
jgi:hypothetical protein